jgi:undecaprenyl-diphosphatase
VDLIQAVVLGLIQGLTEFLPVSSSGHIFLVPYVFGWPDPGAGFTAVIQLGTLLAVLIYFWRDLVSTLKGWIGGAWEPAKRSEPASRLGWAIFVGTLPVAIAGLAFERTIDREFRSPWVVAGTLVGFGLLMALAERVGKRERTFESVRPWDGLVMGLWQALALVPGSSRSGCTITGGLFSGFDRAAAARFSFLLSVPAILVSGLYKLWKESDNLLGAGLAPTLVATFVSFVSGYWAIAFLMKFLQTRSTMVFVVYRVLLGLVVVWFAVSPGQAPEVEAGRVPAQAQGR